nr:LytR C-terminal domain-containing protein [Kibdelosporangium sp. MJ126-NF4]CEL19627.1 protein kinase-like protein [Kibdelosporangium sp. MJ126-NF4]CTQ94573.1 protein kinase-like protein [Kibdelosporangium sp. MJ126-NF4]
MSRLPDPDRSHAVLIGASKYQSPNLPDLPAVKNNLEGMVAALTDERWGGFRRDHCSMIGDSAVARGAYLLLREQAARAEDTFVVYFAGHGLTGQAHNDLYLALGDTETNALGLSALSFELIREVFLDCPAVNRVLILDCCYSGRAARGFMGEPTLGQVEIAGTYTLTSVPPNSLSLAPVGANYTAFTEELLGLFEQGIPDGPELLSLRTLYAHLARRLTSKGYPTPGQRGTDSTDQLALARNPAHQQPAPPVSEQNATISISDFPSAKPRRWKIIKPRRSIISLSVTIVLASWLVIIASSQQNSADSGSTGFSTTTSQTPSTTTSPPPPQQKSGEPPGLPPQNTTTSSRSDRSQPVTVYNNSVIQGLADRAAEDFRKAGWNIAEVGSWQGKIAVTTVYYSPGTAEEGGAKDLADEFELRVEPRFEALQLAEPGLIVIVAKEYNPRSR